jgi:hypothetical protein
MARVVTAAAVLGAATLGAVAFGGPASAVTKIKCTTLSGTGVSATLSHCTGNTGGGSGLLLFPFEPGPGTITWLNGKSTSGTITVGSTEHDTDLRGTCPAGTTEFESTGTVTADTTGSAPVGGIIKGEACYNATTGAVSVEPGSTYVFK